MDAVKFIRARDRMCATYDYCVNCPACRGDDCLVGERNGHDAGVQVKIVEEWAAAHPRETRQSVFLEQWPEAKISDDGSLGILPCMLYFDEYNVDTCTKAGRKCGDCRREFWSQEVE